jgi:intracellular sulfur oxidation DsrE/DsrF family protein
MSKKKKKRPKYRTLVHITAGNETWEPTVEDLVNLTNVVQDAVSDNDDIAVVATREGVSISVINYLVETR